MLKAKQKGFTLLELLVVITLLAILSVGALVAYEGIGDNAQATAAANNTAGADRAIRNYRAVTQNYPDQWDNLVTVAGAKLDFAADETNERLANLDLPASGTAFRTAFNEAFENVGVEELQVRATGAKTAGVEPNLQHNEGAVGASAVETEFGDLTDISILPTYGTTGCKVDGTALGNKLDTTAMAPADGNFQNVVNDSLENNECNLVVALGFGHDAAHSTANSSVAISTAPTYTSKDINPAVSYARYIALFHVGQDGADGSTKNDDITDAELFKKARLLAVVDTEGHVIDTNIANSNPTEVAN